jgi:hypothetical protein
MDVFPALQHSIEIVSKLRALAKKVGDAEFKMLLADLSSELGDAKLEAANLKSELALSLEEAAKLKARMSARESNAPYLENHAYRFGDEEGHFCSACWDVKQRKVRVTAMTGHFSDLATWMCPSCKATYG